MIPVKDGARLLAELLRGRARPAARRGAGDRLGIHGRARVEIARAAGVELLEIAAGRVRPRAHAQPGRGAHVGRRDLLPHPGRRARARLAGRPPRGASSLADRVGASYGPHLPRPDTSPMIARELTEFFAAMAPDGLPQRPDGGSEPTFLSNVNACYARECWEEIRFADVAYAEDQAFGRAMLAAGWTKVYHPGAAVRPRPRLRRRGLRPALLRRVPRPARGHRPRGARGSVRSADATSARGSRATARWMRERGWPARGAGAVDRPLGGPPLGSRVFSVLGSRADRLPGGARAPALARGHRTNGAPEPPAHRSATAAGVGAPVPASSRETRWLQHVLAVSREGVAPLAAPVPGMSERRACTWPWRCPPSAAGAAATTRSSSSSRGSRRWATPARSGSTTPTRATRTGESRGGQRRTSWTGSRRSARPVFSGFDAWHGADVAVATGWETALPARADARLPGPGLPGERPRAGVLRHLGRGAVRRAHVRARVLPDLGQRMAARPAGRALRLRGDVLPPRRRPRRLPPLPVRAPGRHRALLRARGAPRAARCRSACWLSRSCSGAARPAGRDLRRPRADARHLRAQDAGGGAPRRARAGPTARAPWGCACR